MKLEGHGSIQFWLNRLADEEYQKAKKLLDSAMLRNWQAINIKTMHEVHQKKVIMHLINDMKEIGWKDESKDLLTAVLKEMKQ